MEPIKFLLYIFPINGAEKSIFQHVDVTQFFEGPNACKVWEPLFWMISDASVVNIPCLFLKLLTSVGVISLYTEQILKLQYCLLSDAYLLLQLLIRWWLCYLFIKRTRTIHMYVLEEYIYITGVETLSYCNCIKQFVM
jgi:hypothetical protein